MIDCRNFYESDVGFFQAGSDNIKFVAPPTRQFSDFPKAAEELIEDCGLKEAPNTKVFMYCTGGIRCVRASAALKQQGLSNVYQLHGGIQKYLDTYPDGGLFQGKCFVFDNRRLVGAKNGSEVVGKCSLCTQPWERHDSKLRCAACRALVLVCETCVELRNADPSPSPLSCHHCLHGEEVTSS